MSSAGWHRVTETTVITASDEIKLEGRDGLIAATVKFVGNLKSKGETIFYGVELQASKSKGNGTHNGVKYFQCAAKRGVFLKRPKLIEHRIVNTKVPRVSANDYCKVFVRTRYSHGTVKYVGIPGERGRRDVYVGLHLDDAVGDSDGSLFGERYFRVARNRAFFAKQSTSMVVLRQHVYSPKRSKRKTPRSARKSSGSEPKELDLGKSAMDETTRHKKSPKPAAAPPKADYEFEARTKSPTDIADDSLQIPPRSRRTASATTPETGIDTALLSAEHRRSHTQPGADRGPGHVRRATADTPLVKIDIKMGARSWVSLQLPLGFKFSTLLKTLENDFDELLPKQYSICFAQKKKDTTLSNAALEEIRRKDPLFYRNGEFSLKSRPETPKAAKGLMLMEEGQITSALKVLREAIDADPGSQKALLAAGKCCCLSKENFAEAERHFETVLGANQKNVEAWAAYGQVLEARRRFEEAKRCYESVIKHGGATSPLGGVALLRLQFMQMFVDSEKERFAEIESHKKQIARLESAALAAAVSPSSPSVSKSPPAYDATSEQMGSEIPDDGEDTDSHSPIASGSAALGHGRTESEELAALQAPGTPKTKREKLLFASDMGAITERVEDADKIELIMDKLVLCFHICDFTDDSIDEKTRITNKKDILSEVVQVLPTIRWTHYFDLLDICFQVIEKNLFRSFPDENVPFDQDNEDDMDFKDPSWEHLQLVYELSFHVVTNTKIDKRSMKEKLRGGFLANLISLFASPDPREPQYVKIIVHAIYGRFMALRKDIRRHLSDYCYTYIYTCTLHVETWHGLPEILEIFCSIFQGLNEPVKPDYRVLLRNVIVPLHKTHHLDEFHDQLLACIMQFAAKDPVSMPVLIGGLLRFWPKAAPLKEQLFLQELVNFVAIAMTKHPSDKAHKWQPVLQSPAFAKVVLRALDKVMRSMQSTHHQVAERAALVWREECVKRLVDKHKAKVWPKLYATLRTNRDGYWLHTIRSLNKTVLNEMRSRDKDLFAELEERFDEEHPVASSAPVRTSPPPSDTGEDSETPEPSSDAPTTLSRTIVPGMTGARDPSERRTSSRLSKWALIQEAASETMQSKGWGEVAKMPFDTEPAPGGA